MSSPGARVVELLPSNGVPRSDSDEPVRQQHDRGLLTGRALCLGRAERDLGLAVTGLDELVVEPAEDQLVPGAHRERPVANPVRRRAVAPVGAARPRRPEAGRVLGATGVARRVVLVRDPEVVAELVREHADTAVLRLDGVVADAEVRVPIRTPPSWLIGAGRPIPSPETFAVRAMAPDRVGALRPAAGLLTLAGVDRLEVVDVAVRLVEVAVAVVVVPVPLVELRQVGIDLPRRTCRQRSAWRTSRSGRPRAGAGCRARRRCCRSSSSRRQPH